MSTTYNIPGVETCEPCGHPHGPLYVCPHYSSERQADLRAKGDQLRANLRDPAWRAQQVASGVPPVALDLIAIMAGTTESDPVKP